MTKIEWTWRPGMKGVTWNPLVGCSPKSEGCFRCYAARDAAGRLSGTPTYKGLAVFRGVGEKRHAVFTGEIRLLPERLRQPLEWKTPRMIFCNSMADLFHEGVPDSYIDDVLAVASLAKRHVFQILTKWPERAAAYFASTPSGAQREQIVFDARRLFARLNPEPWPGWPLPNVWIVASTENQARYDERIEHLVSIPAARRGLSIEPMLGPIDLSLTGTLPKTLSPSYRPLATALDWVIVGGESGPGARPFRIDWARDVIKQCRENSVHVFVKQLGAHAIERSGKAPGCFRWQCVDKKGGDIEEWPEDVRVREWPE